MVTIASSVAKNIISNPFCGNLINFGCNFMRFFFLGTLYENDSVGTEKKKTDHLKDL